MRKKAREAGQQEDDCGIHSGTWESPQSLAHSRPPFIAIEEG